MFLIPTTSSAASAPAPSWPSSPRSPPPSPWSRPCSASSATRSTGRASRRYDAETIAKQAAYDHETNHAGFWGRVTRLVMARPVISVVLAAGLLIVAALPYVDLDRGQSGVETLPPSNIRTAYELLDRDFPAGRLAPVEIVIDGRPHRRDRRRHRHAPASLASDSTFGPIDADRWNAEGDLALVRSR